MLAIGTDDDQTRRTTRRPARARVEPAREAPPVRLVTHACFECRRCVKVPPRENPCECARCGGLLRYMGSQFTAPRRADEERWEIVRRLWEAGFRFSRRGASTLPELPRTLAEVDRFIALNLTHPDRWRSYNPF